MSLLTVDAAVRMKLLIKHMAPGGQQEVYNCVLCQCSISGNISAQSHLYGIKHQKALKKSNFNTISAQNSTPRVGVGTQVPSISKVPSTHNSIPSRVARPQMPARFSSPQNSFPSLVGRPQTPVRFIRPQNLTPSLGGRPQIQARFPCTHNSIPSLGCRPQIPARFPCTHNSIPSLGGRPQIPVRFASIQNSILSLGGRPQMQVRLPCTHNSNLSPGGRPQNPVRFFSLNNSIPSANRPQIANTPKYSKTQKSFQSVSVKPKKSNKPTFAKTQKSSKFVKGKILSSPVAAGFSSSVAKSKEESLVKSINLGIMTASGDGSQYRCEVCSKSLNATSQVTEHINGAPHQKKLRLHPKYRHLALPSTTTPSPKKSDVTSVKTSHLNTSPKSTNFGAIVALHLDSSTKKLNIACNTGPTATSISAPNSSVPLNKSKKRKNNRNNNGPTATSQFAPKSRVPLKKSRKRKNVRNKKGRTAKSKFAANSRVPLNKSKKRKKKGKIDAMIQKGIENGSIIIKEFGDQQFFKCNVCNKTCTGNIPMKHHIISESHIKKLSASPPNASSTTVGPSASGQNSHKLPEEIADIIVVHAHESLDSLFN